MPQRDLSAPGLFEAWNAGGLSRFTDGISGPMCERFRLSEEVPGALF